MKGQEPNIDYAVVRSRRSTVDIIIERDGSVLVRAPEWVNDQQVEKVVQSRQYWIYQSLAEWRDLNATRVLREYKNGEGFLYLGRAYRLRLANNQDAPLQFQQGRFMLRRDLVESGDVATAKAAFRDYYIARGLDRIGQRVAYFAPKVGVEPTDIDVRELGHRWASCSPTGKLAFHWKCMMAPQTIIDYIVVHHHRDHTDAFWNEVDKVMPEYRERKEWLRKNGAGLDI
ncbi:protein of unknown function DUF45 [Nitrosococcus halophilus Nc 4]|uniref:YgjP-like metallopeptidase domain-containing protein n=1 Tax=Nitrosococcus halophilus (strain Nc4) TaxID=472759 RepID=D5C186_NITHN|nr:protein of unknown function DUF45 [Nitrosococcus halophilus Nc 4]